MFYSKMAIVYVVVFLSVIGIAILISNDIVPGKQSIINMFNFNKDEGEGFVSSQPAEINNEQLEGTVKKEEKEEDEVPKSVNTKKKKKKDCEESSILGFSSNEQYASV